MTISSTPPFIKATLYFALTSVWCTQSQAQQVVQPATVVDAIEKSPVHTRLSSMLLLDANLRDELSQDGPYTVFAPTDTAFNGLPTARLEQLSDRRFLPHLSNILEYHVLSGIYLLPDLTEGENLQTFNGQSLEVESLEPTLQINGALVAEDSSVVTENGIVHVLPDQVLLPSWINKTAGYYIVSSPDLSMFSSLASRTGLFGLWNSTTPITVFAPTNQAFEYLGENVLAELENNTDLLLNILQFHVVENDVLTEQGLTAMATLTNDDATITMSNGVDAVVTTTDFTTIVAGAPIVDPDHLVDNGVVHVIDTVMELPVGEVENDNTDATSDSGSGTLSPESPVSPEPAEVSPSASSNNPTDPTNAPTQPPTSSPTDGTLSVWPPPEEQVIDGDTSGSSNRKGFGVLSTGGVLYTLISSAMALLIKEYY